MTLIMLMLSTLWLQSPVDSGMATLSIEIDDVREEKGQMMIKIYTPDNDFLSHDTYKLLKVAAQAPSTVTDITLPKGRYAIAIYHDIDMSGKMNKNFIGMPKEPVGISNDAIKGFSKPTFEEASFSLEESTTIYIDLRHF